MGLYPNDRGLGVLNKLKRESNITERIYQRYKLATWRPKKVKSFFEVLKSVKLLGGL
jgi:hypothetical protein